MNWKQITPLAELGVNVALNILGAEGVTPANTAVLAQGVEAAVNPLLSAVQTGKQPTSTTILAGYGALIGTLSTLKGNTALPADVLAKVEEYIEAAQAGTAAYVQAQAGFNPALFAVDGPIPQSGS